MKYEDFIKDFRENPSKYQHRIIWYIGVMKVNRHRYHVGWCTYGKGIAFITPNPLLPYVNNSIIIQPEIEGYSPMLCSDGKFCKNKKCPLAHGQARHNFEEIEKKLEELGYGFDKANCERVIFDKPLIEIRRSK